ncbi:DUF7487 domain-containing protein [Brevibacillus laterosporus]|uniref:DUF7487 domain-containing protein n=1 Tax=Brevibacillus laterosporus TaxID=1465 RepID=UPI0018F89B1E|nr:hypothetical protein [Brevibacillus laterosporus]MBG9776210.1 hypothetical protein [Brevibacillus laterosporus]
MLINDQLIEMNWNPSNRKHYESLGYKFTKYKDIFLVSPSDLSLSSRQMVKIQCDYCGMIFKRMFRYYTEGKENNIKDSCKKCQRYKLNDTLKDKYGVNHTMQIAGVREKIKQTCLTKYGTKHHLSSNIIKDKRKNTILKKYGVDHYSKTNEYKEKFMRTSIKKYGVKHPWLNKNIINKRVNTYLSNYGETNPMKNSKIKRKLLKRLYEDGKAPCSKQQKYINNLIQGKLNYPVGTCLLDIAFPEDKIYVEYDGSGHDLTVKFGKETKEEFNDRNKKRCYFLNRNNWKEIRIISTKDVLPSNEKILEIISYAKSHFNKGHSWITFDIDNYLIETSSNTHYFDYGQLRRIS